VVEHRARQFGHSKYGVRRILKGFLDLLTVHFLTDYGQRPQHLLGGFGLFCFSLGGLGAFVLSLWWILSRLFTAFGEPVHLHEKAIFYFALTALILGAQFMLVGFLAELMTFHAYRDFHPYSIKNHVGNLPTSPTELPSDDVPQT
jgi:dolichol-phosphate mannosyltransferase